MNSSKRRSRSGAQRLSASKRIALDKDATDKEAKKVLNAFRHQRESHRRETVKMLMVQGVLNAFRHQRESHRESVRIMSVLSACSTPFGIKENRTGRQARRSSRSLIQCSTPFGIKENRTRRSDSSTRIASSAQRLSASKRIARSALRQVVSGQLVLNAFRHQRESHDDGAADGSARQEVLNAFRHQRESHALFLCSIATETIECSTPFGIKENRTGALEVATLPQQNKCSTPFGIKENRTVPV